MRQECGTRQRFDVVLIVKYVAPQESETEKTINDHAELNSECLAGARNIGCSEISDAR